MRSVWSDGERLTIEFASVVCTREVDDTCAGIVSRLIRDRGVNCVRDRRSVVRYSITLRPKSLHVVPGKAGFEERIGERQRAGDSVVGRPGYPGQSICKIRSEERRVG